MTPAALDVRPAGPLKGAWSRYIHARRAKADYTAALTLAGFEPAMFTDGGLHPGGLASNFARVWNWVDRPPAYDCSEIQRETSAGLARAPVSLVAAWTWALTVDPDVWPTDLPQVGLGMLAVLPYRHTPLGWLHKAAGITADEALTVPADTVLMMAALRNPWVPAATPARHAPLVAP